ncbi:hypothetical protein [Hyphococcus luteus]|uniref:DUF2178 domain-containing protein n=1 Tax=Hyphococcus luteus TaxID=2058213 RepID=A0A2S7K6J6_9PROT|nr:hypothetical protein [Marinicaulis flavus]PQA88135.1 hypothetical protein CW354_07395 [Marinicaulis flavus]
MTFKEKSAWIMLAALIWIFGGYAWSLYEAGSFGAGTTDVMVVTIISFVALIVAAHIAAAIFSPKSANEAEDERDRRIELKADELGGFVLGLAALFALAVALFEGAYLTANILFLGLAASEIVKTLYQVFLYRRGA